MKRLFSVMTAIFVCVSIAAEPTTTPTTKPTTKPAKQVSWQAIVRSLPKEMRAPKGQAWAYGERIAASKWVAAQLAGTKINVQTVFFHWNGGEHFQASYQSEIFRAHGINWQLQGDLMFAAAEVRKAARRREDDTIGIAGSVDKAELGSGGEAMISVVVSVKDAEIK